MEVLTTRILGDQGTFLLQAGIMPEPKAMASIVEPPSAPQSRELVPRQSAMVLLEPRLFLSFEGAAHECSSHCMSQSPVPHELLQCCRHSSLSPHFLDSI